MNNLSYNIMNYYYFFYSIFLGFIEGITEFIPVSSTAHIMIVGYFIGFNSPDKNFEILIQLSAIIGLMVNFYKKSFLYLINASNKNKLKIILLNIFIAILPSILLGILLHNFIKNILLNSLYISCISLIIGGFILIFIDKIKIHKKYYSVFKYPKILCFYIGIFQCLALIPGISRSGSTIISAIAMGADKRSSAEFSFALAVPTIIGAFIYNIFNSYNQISNQELIYVILGSLSSFITSIFVSRNILNYISIYGYYLFGYWRIIFGTIAIIYIYFF